MRNGYKTSVENPKGRYQECYIDYIKIDSKQIGFEGMDWI
jgi:hypothetical protein